MKKTEDFRKKQLEELEKMTPKERSLAYGRMALLDIENNKDALPEPECLASGKTDKDGNMVDEEPGPEEDEHGDLNDE